MTRSTAVTPGVVAGVMLSASLLSGPAAQASAPSGASLVASSMAALRAEDGFHWTSTAIFGSLSLTFTTYVGTNRGFQSMLVKSGTETGHVSAILIGQKVYFLGDAIGLAYLDFSQAAATAETNKWIYAAKGVKGQASTFTSVAAGLTISSTVSELEITNVDELAPVHFDGQKVVPLKGSPKYLDGAPSGSTQVLYVQADGKRLPVKAVEDGKGFVSTTVLGSWGQVPSVTVPLGAVSLQASWLAAPSKS